jgi:hypothetical protein
VALQGTLDTFALPDVLRLLAATKKTGRLRITGARGAGSAWVRDGSVAAVAAEHAPLAVDPGDALFELLRFEEGAFSFEPDEATDADGDHDVEPLLEQAEALLQEWRQIESVVPSLDAWVTLRRTLDAPVTIDTAHWTTLVAVGRGATVASIAAELELAELPVSRAVRDLLAIGVAELQPEAPADARPAPAPVPAISALQPTSQPPLGEVARAAGGLDLPSPITPEPELAPSAWSTDSLLDGEPEPSPDAQGEPESADAQVLSGTSPIDDSPADDLEVDDEPLPVARPIRARRPRGLPIGDERGSGETDRFVPLELPGGLSGSYDSPVAGGDVPPSTPDVDDLAAAFPGLANRTAPVDAPVDEDEIARQLATLSPRAAEAVRAAAEAPTDEEREAAIDEVVASEDQPLNRGLLLKFLSSVKS